MGGTGTGGIDFMSVFNIIIMLYGAYSMYTARKMQMDGNPPQWLVSQEELQRMRKPKQFCEIMAPKTMVFGLMCVVYGLFSLVETFFLKNTAAEVAEIAFFIVVIIWFIMNLRRAKRDCM